MAKTGTNLVNLRANNKLTILRLLNANGAMSRKDIATLLKLTPAAVTILCNEIIKAGMIVEKGEVEEEKRAGRKKMLIDINHQYKYIIGINIEPDYTYLNIANLKGESILAKKIHTDNAILPSAYLIQLSNECIRMLWEANLKKEDILGVGVGIIGAVDIDRGVSKSAYAVWKEEVPIRNIIEKELLLPVLVDNNVRASVLGEILYGETRDIDNMLFVKWGPGVGSAVVINRKIYVGENFKSSTLGHFIVDRDGRMCRCGKRGCIETIACKEAVYAAIKKIAENGTAKELLMRLSNNLEQLDVENIFEYIDVRDEPIREYVDSIIDMLAISLGNAVTILSPQKVLLFGKAFENDVTYKRFVESYKAIHNESYREAMFTKSSIMQKLNYIGPIAIVADKMFFNPPDIL